MVIVTPVLGDRRARCVEQQLPHSRDQEAAPHTHVAHSRCTLTHARNADDHSSRLGFHAILLATSAPCGFLETNRDASARGRRPDGAAVDRGRRLHLCGLWRAVVGFARDENVRFQAV